MNRRTFMQTATTAMAGIAVTKKNGYAKDAPGAANLFFDPDELSRIRQSWSLPVFKEFTAQVLAVDLAADETFLKKELDTRNHIRHLQRADIILQREAFAYLVTEKTSRLELARLAIEKILSFTTWDYFMEAGQEVIGLQRAPETTIAMSLAYDWLNARLDDRTKREMRRQIADKGCMPCYRTLQGLRHPDSVVGWSFAPWVSLEPRDFSRWPIILDKTNLKAIPIAGLAIGAMLLRESEPRSAEWIEMVRHGYETIATLYERDGSYPEGGSYGDYTTFHLLLTQAVLQRKLGLDLFDAINYNGFVEFMLALQLPHSSEPRACINFGDAGSGLQSSVSFYVAGKTGDGLAQYMGLEHPREHNPFSIIWYHPDVAVEKPSARHHFTQWDLDWMVYRTGYGLDDFVVAMRSGGPANHEHADRNSILLKAYGEVLLADSKHPTYDHNNPGWVLRASPAHNTVLIDQLGHQYHDGREGTNSSLASARIIRSGQRHDLVFWCSDATPAYQLVLPDVARVLRSVFVFTDAPVVVIIDTMEKKSRPSLFSSHWHVENSDLNGSVQVLPEGFIMKRPGADFYAASVSLESLAITAEQITLPPEVGVRPYVRVATTRPALQHTMVTVGMAAHAQEAAPMITVTPHGLVTIRSEQGRFEAQITNLRQVPFLVRT